MPRDDDLGRLSDDLAGLVAGDVPELLAEARAEARTRVRAVLVEALAEAMLAQARHSAAPRREPTGPGPGATAPADVAGPLPTPPAGPDPDPPRRGHADYVYGVTTAAGDALPQIAGVDPGYPVTLSVAGDLAAIVSAVPLAEFDEERLREHLGDLGWVETVARRHEDALEAVATARTVIPMRMCSIYREPDGVARMLRTEAAVIRDALKLLSGRDEWGVKVFAIGAPEPPDALEVRPPATGADYLEGRRAARRQRADAGDALADACAAVHDRLSALAVAAKVIAPQRREVSGHDGDMVLNGVYLVETSSVDTFHAAVAALQDELSPAGAELIVTGPWPAYHFVPDPIGTPS